MPDNDAVSAALAAAARVEAEEGGPSPAAPAADAGLTDAADFEVTSGRQGEPERENGNGERTPARTTRTPDRRRSSIALSPLAQLQLEHEVWRIDRVREEMVRHVTAEANRKADHDVRAEVQLDMFRRGQLSWSRVDEEIRKDSEFAERFVDELDRKYRYGELAWEQLPAEIRDNEQHKERFAAIKAEKEKVLGSPATVLDRDKLKESAKAAIERAKNTGVRLSQFIDPLVAQLAAIAPNGTSEEDIKSIILEAAKEVNN